MDQSEQYLLHAAGMYAFLGWIEDQKNSGTPVRVDKQTFFLHPLTSRYFSIGLSTGKKVAKLPFLAVQPNEASWMKLVQWDRFFIRENDLNLYLVSKMVAGDGTDFPDIPPFAIAIAFDSEDKIKLLGDIGVIDGREYHKEDASQYFQSDTKVDRHFAQGSVRINLHSKLFGAIKINQLSKQEPYLDANMKYINYSNILTGKEAVLQNDFSGVAPVFQGDERQAKTALDGFWNKINEQGKRWE